MPTAPPPFEFIQGNERLDWGILVSIDVERLLCNPNVETLQRIVGNLGFSRIHREEVAMFNADHVVHLLRLYQIIVQYVIYSQDCLAKINCGITGRNKELRQQLKEAENNLAEAVASNSELKKTLANANASSQYRKENEAERDAAVRQEVHKFTAGAEGGVATSVAIHVCPFCKEQYHKIESLQSHLRKRHSISPSSPANPPPPSSSVPCGGTSPDSAPSPQATRPRGGVSDRNASNSDEVRVLSGRIEELEKQIEQDRRFTTDNLLRDHHYLVMLLLQSCRGGKGDTPVLPADLPIQWQKLLSSLPEGGSPSTTREDNRYLSAPNACPAPLTVTTLPGATLEASSPPPISSSVQPHVVQQVTTVDPPVVPSAPLPPPVQSAVPSGVAWDSRALPPPSATTVNPTHLSEAPEAARIGNTGNVSRLPFQSVSTTPPPNIATIPVVPDVGALSSAVNEQIRYRQDLYEKELSSLKGDICNLRQEWQEKQHSGAVALTVSPSRATTTPTPVVIAAPTATPHLAVQASDSATAVNNLAKYGPPGAAFIPPKRTPSPQRVSSSSRTLWLSPPPTSSYFPQRIATAAPQQGDVVAPSVREPSLPSTATTGVHGPPPGRVSPPASFRAPATSTVLTSFERVEKERSKSPQEKRQTPEKTSAREHPTSVPAPVIVPSAAPSVATPAVPVLPSPIPLSVVPVQAPSPTAVAPTPSSWAPGYTPVAAVQPPAAVPPVIPSPVSGDSQKQTSHDAPLIAVPKPLSSVEVHKPAVNSIQNKVAATTVVKRFNPAASDTSSSYSYSYSEDK